MIGHIVTLMWGQKLTCGLRRRLPGMQEQKVFEQDPKDSKYLHFMQLARLGKTSPSFDKLRPRPRS